MIKGFGRYNLSGGSVRGQETASYRSENAAGVRGRATPRVKETASNTSVSAMGFGGVTADDLALSYVGGSTNQRGQATFSAPPEIYKYYAAIFREDGVCGASVELRANIPYSSFRLTGMKDPGKLAKYSNGIERMRLESMMATMSMERDAMGAFFGVLDWDADGKAYDSLLRQSRMDISKILYSPVHGMDPVVDVMPSQLILDLLNSTDPRTEALKKCIPSFMRDSKSGSAGVPIPMESIVWVARHGADPRYNSIFHRIVPIFLIERALTRGTIDGSHRRQKPILHIQMGQGDEWIPTPDEFNEISGLFTDADADPLGAIVATRDGINISEVRSPADFWKITDIADQTLPFKLRALGVSEAFLSADASFANADAAISVFMETIRSERAQFDRQLFYDKLFPQIAIANAFYKVGASRDTGDKSLNGIKAMDRLDMPRVEWAKSLQPEGDATYIATLNDLADKDVPITIRLLAAAGGLDFDTLVAASDQDYEDRKKLTAMKEKIKALAPDTPDADANEFASLLVGDSPNMLKPQGILNRDYGDLDRFVAAPLDHRGKRQPASAKWKREFRDDAHKTIARAAAELARKSNHEAREAGLLTEVRG